MIVINDLTYAIRVLLKRPGFAILTTLVMASGIGLSVYLFSFMNTMLFKDLPFENGDTLVQISSSQNGVKNIGQVNLHDYHEIRMSLKGMVEFGAYKNASVNVSARDGARRYHAILAEPNIFQLTRTKPILGREFTDAENRQGAEYVVVIGYDVWQNQFGGDDKAVGQAMRINGESHRVIGIMPEGYFFPNVAEMWLPLRKDVASSTRENSENLYGLAHLNGDISIKDINLQLAVIMQRIAEKYPKTNNGIGAYVSPIPLTVAEDGIAVVYSMQIVAILILILASINVGNLLLSRAVERGKETAIRMALGAPRSRLISQMLWESIIICSVGGLIGLFIMAWGLEVTEEITAAFSAGKQVFWFKFGIDAFTIKLFISFVLSTIIVTGLLPAWKNSGADFNSVLRDGTRGALGKRAGRLNRFLVISEIFVSMTVLIAAGVMIIAAYTQTHQDNGADIKNILTAEVLLTEASYETPLSQVQFVKKLQSRLENSSTIGNVIVTTALPSVVAPTPMIAFEGMEYNNDRGYPRANYILVTPGSLAKLGIELKEGRYFNNGDDGLEKKSAIVTESFTSRHFPNVSAIGKRIRIAEHDGDEPDWLTIAGVVENTLQGNPGDNAKDKFPTVYRPFSQEPRLQMTIAMQMKSNQAAVIRTLRETLQSIDPELPAFRIENYEDKIGRFSGPIRFISKVFLLFGIAAAVLAASGIYGVMSNTVNQRIQEIGVKRALGANEQRITKEFLKTGFILLLWGGVPGLFAGCGIGFALSQVFGSDNHILFIVAIIMLAIIGLVVMLATYLPTKRVLRMEPGEALHYE
ncbi:ABC transporter permease [Paremcibacter congregatus]|uniref:ABC transporter permease n=1 Tax=Paremcibacter congregatus TaxID=2043170 RepID=A0A2G4YNI7_9PROT|nr:ABC transporter permease [Paremcibacter congregatus]PHZ83882.1 ABC transporter permease [Paremcibacter congregatus]QDE27586.1 FtsX-like permease family protein [Paremcibacter congregatus]